MAYKPQAANGCWAVYFKGVALTREVERNAIECKHCGRKRVDEKTGRVRPLFSYGSSWEPFCNLDCWAAFWASTFDAYPVALRHILSAIAHQVNWPIEDIASRQLTNELKEVVLKFLDEKGLLKEPLEAVFLAA